MKKIIHKILYSIVHEEISKNIPFMVKQAAKVAHQDLFSYIGISRLREMIDEAEKKGEKYVSLAELFSQVCRNNLSKENGDIIHSYHELLPKLNDYTKRLNDITTTE